MECFMGGRCNRDGRCGKCPFIGKWNAEQKVLETLSKNGIIDGGNFYTIEPMGDRWVVINDLNGPAAIIRDGKPMSIKR